MRRDGARSAVAWSAFAYGAGRGATVLSTLVLARLLTPDAFGVVAAVLVYLSLVELASDLGMQATVVFEQEDGISDRVQSAFTFNLLLAGALSVVAVAAAPLAARFFGIEGQTDLFRLAALNPVLTALGNIHDGLLMRGMAFRRRVRPQVLRAGVRAAVGVGLALWGLGAASLVIAFLVGTAVWVVALWSAVPLRPTFRLDRAVVRSMAGYGGGAVLLEVVSVLATRVDVAIIGSALGAGALGLYVVAYRIPEMLIESVSWNVSLVAFPLLARRRATDPATLAQLTLRVLRACSLYALPVATWLALAAVPLVVVLFGERWRPAAGVLAAIAVMTAAVAIAFPLGDVFKALGRQRVLVALSALMLPVMVAAILLAAPGGIVPAAWARCAVGAVQCLVMVVLVARVLKIDGRQVGKAILPGLVVALTVGFATVNARAWMPGDDALALACAVAAGAVGALAGAAAVEPHALGGLTRRLGALRATHAGGNP